MPLKETKYNCLILTLRRRSVFEGTAKLVNPTSSRLYLPAHWADKKVIVVLKDEQ
jgi:hypothetical protein